MLTQAQQFKNLKLETQKLKNQKNLKEKPEFENRYRHGTPNITKITSLLATKIVINPKSKSEACKIIESLALPVVSLDFILEHEYVFRKILTSSIFFHINRSFKKIFRSLHFCYVLNGINEIINEV